MSIKTSTRKTAESDIAAICRETGPNGYPVGCNDEGDLIEITDNECCGGVFFRGEQSIAVALAELSDMAWRDAHREWLVQIATGDIRPTAEDESYAAYVETQLHDCATRYGKEDMSNEFYYGMMIGKLRALIWLGGRMWENDGLVREDDEPFVIRRSWSEVFKQQVIVCEKVWWNRHQNLLYNISVGTEKIGCEEIFARAKKAARRVERKYGRKNLGWSDFDWSILNGQFSALRWLLGDEWDNLDT